MAWTKAKTAVVAGFGLLLAVGTTTVSVAVNQAQANSRLEAQRAYGGTTQMDLTGPAGAVVIGFYVQNGARVAVSNAIPWSLSETNVSRFGFRCLDPSHTINISLVYDGDGSHIQMTQKLDSESAWVMGRVQNGFAVIKRP